LVVFLRPFQCAAGCAHQATSTFTHETSTPSLPRPATSRSNLAQQPRAATSRSNLAQQPRANALHFALAHHIAARARRKLHKAGGFNFKWVDVVRLQRLAWFGWGRGGVFLEDGMSVYFFKNGKMFEKKKLKLLVDLKVLNEKLSRKLSRNVYEILFQTLKKFRPPVIIPSISLRHFLYKISVAGVAGGWSLESLDSESQRCGF
jgi:hypothetical protein